MGYNRSYYAHGAENFAYNWHGRIQYPAKKNGGSLAGYGSLGSGTPDPLDAKIDETGTKTKTDAKWVPYVQQLQALVNASPGMTQTPIDGLLSSLLPRAAAVLKTSEATIASMTYRQLFAGLQAAQSRPIPTSIKIGVGVGLAGLIYMVARSGPRR
jgi:hypothetical protein